MSISALSTLTASTASSTASTNTSTTQTSSTQSTAATPAVSQLLAKADQRIQSDVDATTAQLSSFGLLKSAVSTSQTAAQALTSFASSASNADITQAAGDFFNAFNATAQAASTTAAVPGSAQAAQSASRVGRDMKWALTSNPATDDAMRKLGFQLQPDGTLKHDSQKFAAALSADPAGVKAALATIGKQVSAAATKELSSNGTVSAGMASLTQHSTKLAAQQKAMLQVETALASAQSSSSSSSGLNGGYTGMGLSAYLANSN